MSLTAETHRSPFLEPVPTRPQTKQRRQEWIEGPVQRHYVGEHLVPKGDIEIPAGEVGLGWIFCSFEIFNQFRHDSRNDLWIELPIISVSLWSIRVPRRASCPHVMLFGF